MGDINHKDQLIAQLRAEIAARDAALADIRTLMGRLVGAIHGRISESLKETGGQLERAQADQADRADIE